MNALVPIADQDLTHVTGGRSSSNIDSLLSTLDSLTSTIKDIKNKTNGLGQGEMLLLCMLAMQSRQTNVVYVNRRRPCW